MYINKLFTHHKVRNTPFLSIKWNIHLSTAHKLKLTCIHIRHFCIDTWLLYTPHAFLALAHVGVAILLPEKAISGSWTGSACIITTFTPRELFMTAKFQKKTSGRFQSFLTMKYIANNKFKWFYVEKYKETCVCTCVFYPSIFFYFP